MDNKVERLELTLSLRMENSYKLNVFCKNCDFEGDVEIPKGTTYEKRACPDCGNMTLEKKLKSVRLIPHSENYF